METQPGMSDHDIKAKLRPPKYSYLKLCRLILQRDNDYEEKNSRRGQLASARD